MKLAKDSNGHVLGYRNTYFDSPTYMKENHVSR